MFVHHKDCIGMRILFSWIGHADLLGVAGASGDKDFMREIGCLIGKDNFSTVSPISVVVKQKTFDRIILLWNYSAPELCSKFQKAWGANTELVSVNVENPTDYSAIYQVVERVIAENCTPDDDLFYLLSPGTPAMAAIWVLLGKTKYPGKFLQTYQNQVTESIIPFDLKLDVIPELMRRSGELLEQSLFSSSVAGFEEIIGGSLAIRECIARAAKAALYDVSVLLTGESGSGKEMFAQAIYRASLRKNAPFEAINCAALPPNLLEAELFGYKKGSFTGAAKDKAGAFHRVNGGTLFLDEIGECSPELQAKLLRVLQPPSGNTMTCREFYPVGAERPEYSDVRIIAATNRNLREMMREEQFRSDLFFRLAAISIHLPPLRERKADILPIADALLQRANRDFARLDKNYIDKIFSDDTKIFVQKRPWYGNVRELYNAVLQGIVMSSGKIIEISDLGCSAENVIQKSREISPGFSLEAELENLEKEYITQALLQADNNKSKAARLLGFSNYQRLDARMKRLKIEIK